MKKYFKGTTDSGDLYSATIEKWREYWIAWKDNDLNKVMHFETGQDEDFFYDPEE